MEIRLCKTNAEFAEKYGTVLDENEAELQLFSVNLTGDETPSKEHIRGAAYDKDEPILLFLNAYPFNLQLYALRLSTDSVKLLAEHIIAENISINGVQGRPKVCEAFVKAYRDATGKSMILFHDMSTLVTDSPVRPDVDGSLYVAQESDEDTLVEYIITFYKECHAEKLTEPTARQTVRSKTESNELFVYYVKNQPVGMCCCQKRGKRGMTVSLVYTDKERRSRGYAKAMVYLLSSRLLKNSEYVTLFVEKTNAAAYKVYSDVGFKFVAENCDYRII